MLFLPLMSNIPVLIFQRRLLRPGNEDALGTVRKAPSADGLMVLSDALELPLLALIAKRSSS